MVISLAFYCVKGVGSDRNLRHREERAVLVSTPKRKRMSVLRICGGLSVAALLMWEVAAPTGAFAETLGRFSRHGLDISVVMEEPEGSVPVALTMPVDVATHHVEVIARFAKGNPYGGVPGAFFPYLGVVVIFTYEKGTESIQARLHPLAHTHEPGLHYGVNVRLPRKGNYRVTVTVDPPSDWDLGRHNDVRGWFQPIAIPLGYKWK
jgi:uncharacterized protein involved in high-affinity Fe2+ transport